MLSVIIVSSDGYSDCWDPMFKCLLKYFPRIKDFEIFLSTNSKDYFYPDLNITTIKHGHKASWSKRLKNTLKLINDDLVLVIVEDFILRSKIDEKKFDQLLGLISHSTEIDHIRLMVTLNKVTLHPSKFDLLNEFEDDSKMRFSYLPGIWKKDILNKYLLNHESIFLSEKIGDYRSRIYRHGFFTVKNVNKDPKKQFFDTDASGVMFKGKWPLWVPNFFEKEGIGMNFDLRGFATKDFRKESRKSSKKQLLTSPILTFRSFWSLAILYLKQIDINFKNKKQKL